MKKDKISVCINTYNRPVKIRECVKSILENNDTNFEVVVIDQSEKPDLIKCDDILNNKHIFYYHHNQRGTGRAKNIAISKANGKIIAFTDDDCIVRKNWLKKIREFFLKNPKNYCVTGNVYPYRSIKKHSCPPTISRKTKIFETPTHHSKIGYGNNIIFSKNVFSICGYYKNWLGPGSIATNCEDGEIILRLLTHGLSIFHFSEIIVYHNKNLTEKELEKQNLSYICGEMSCYTFYALNNYKFAKKVIINNFYDTYRDIIKLLKNLFFYKEFNYKYLIHILRTMLIRFKGFVIGTFFYIREVKYHKY